MENNSPSSPELIDLLIIPIRIPELFAGLFRQQPLNEFIVHVKYFLPILKLHYYVVVVIPIWLFVLLDISPHLHPRSSPVVLLLQKLRVPELGVMSLNR